MDRSIVDVHEFQCITDASAAPEASRILADAISMGLMRQNGFLQLTAEFIKDELVARAPKPRTWSAEKIYLG